MLSYDDRDLGLNNQLASLSFMLCVARGANACGLYVPPLGYFPCGTHAPGKRDRKGCHVTSNATVDALDLIEPDAVDLKLLRSGQRQHLNSSMLGRCRKGETGCGVCGPYNINPYRCMRNAIDTNGSQRQHMIYAYGLKYHLRSHRRPDLPVCPPMRLRLAPAVEAYTRQLMARLQLVPGQFVAAQLRTGWAWRVHSFRNRHEWSCYGMATINATLAKLRRASHRAAAMRVHAPPSLSTPLETPNGRTTKAPQAALVADADAAAARALPMPEKLFLLTNERNIHESGVPVPIQVMAEMRVTSLAHTVLLNPMSSFQDAVRQLRGSADRVFYVDKRNFVADDYCGCTAADEMAQFDRQRRELCGNMTNFRGWLSSVETAEKTNLAKRREGWQRAQANRSRDEQQPRSRISSVRSKPRTSAKSTLS
jgi:hypothetical protein